ncbi:MAG: hypothetical protein IT460_01145 [Planctomycetes bacterium]|nr:hypothetical protein [Planctomycetota bacterium]
MARSKIPDVLEMRRLKFDAGVAAAEKDAVAEALRAEGRASEALLLFEGRADHPSLEADRRDAIRHGYGWRLLAMKRLGVAVTDDEVRACAGAAETAGRWFEANRCYTTLGDAEAVARIAPNLPGYKPAIPANKV